MAPYSVRAQVGLLISQRSKQRLREGNGGPEATLYGLGQNIGLNAKPQTSDRVLHSTPRAPLYCSELVPCSSVL